MFLFPWQKQKDRAIRRSLSLALLFSFYQIEKIHLHIAEKKYGGGRRPAALWSAVQLRSELDSSCHLNLTLRRHWRCR